MFDYSKIMDFRRQPSGVSEVSIDPGLGIDPATPVKTKHYSFATKTSERKQKYWSC